MDNPTLANPNRPVWILENKFPRIEGDPAPEGSSPGTVAQTNTFGFGELPAGERLDYDLEADAGQGGHLHRQLRARGRPLRQRQGGRLDGAQPKGKFVVTITDKPPEARVNDAGQVETTG